MTRRDAIRQLSLFLSASPLLRSQLDPRSGHQRVPGIDELANVFEFEPIARAKMGERSYDYVAGGVEDEFSLRRNREAFDWVTLHPRVRKAVKSVDASVEIFGKRMPYPIMVAPTGGQSRVHPQGDVDMHRGASAANTTMIVSHVATFPIEQIVEAGEGPFWKQLYVHMNQQNARERIDQAAAAGAEAIAWTVDAQYSSLRERLRHDRHLETVDASASARQSRSRSTRRRRRVPNPYGLNPETPDLDWKFLKTLREWTTLPLVVKGLLTAEDAHIAVEEGADGIVVSNHGARYMPYSPATIEVLPEILNAVGGKMPVLIDGGFRRGSDIVKALALGARAVCLGRAPLWGLGAFGAAGAQRVLELLQAETAHAMAGLGASRVSDLDPSLVQTDFP